jgi:hypothetical protein
MLLVQRSDNKHGMQESFNMEYLLMPLVKEGKKDEQ